MNRLIRLREIILRRSKTAGIFIASGAILTGITYYLYDDSLATKESLGKENEAITQQIITTDQRNERANNTLEFYNKLTKDSRGNSLDLDRDQIRERLDALKAKHRLADLTLSIAPIDEKTDGVFAKKTGKIIVTSLAVNFAAMTDQDAFGFATDLLENFSGFLNIRKFIITRPERIDDKIIKAIQTKGESEIIRGTIEFDWLGLRINAEEDPQK